MEIKLTKRPKNPIIIEGFPGFGLVGTITTGFLIDHLKAKPIGMLWSDELAPIIAIHGSEVMLPLQICYDAVHNIIILHALSNVAGMEWKIAEAVLKIAKELKAKEIVSVEGIGSAEISEPTAFFYSTHEKGRKRFEKLGVKMLKEGIVVGVSGALLLKTEIPFSCLFAETHSQLPDSKAAAKIIETLDAYLGLKVDYRPLLKTAEKVEEKLKELLEKTKETGDIREKKKLNYFG